MIRTIKILLLCIALLAPFQPRIGSADDLDAGFYLWRLINEARRYPGNALAKAGIDLPTAREHFGIDEVIFYQGLPPLAWNDCLFSSASGHNQDMIQHLYYSYDSLDGTTVLERIEKAGYIARDTAESLGAIVFETYLEPTEAAAVILDYLLMDELKSETGSTSKIFSQSFTEVGISLRAAKLDLGKDLPIHVYIAVIDFGQPLAPRTFVVGNIYRDPNGDGIMDPLDAESGVELILRHSRFQGSEVNIPIMPFGAYQVEHPVGFSVLEARDSAEQVIARRSMFYIINYPNKLVDLHPQ